MTEEIIKKMEQVVSKVRERELNYSIVTARNLGIENKDREPTTIRIEKFLLSVMTLHGLNCSDVVNISLESYLMNRGFLTLDSLSFVDTISEMDKAVLRYGLTSLNR